MSPNTPYIKDISQKKETYTSLGDSKFVLSKLNEYHHHESSSPFSIKMVVDGVEHYTLDHRKYTLKADQFVIVNHQDSVDIKVDTTDFTHGICIYPPEDFITDAFRSANSSLNQILENESINRGEIRFTQKVNSMNNESKTSNFLKQNLSQILTTNTSGGFIDFDLFYSSLAAAMVTDQHHIENQLIRLKSIKTHTKEELFRRLHLSKDFIRDNYNKKLSLEELASLSCLSKYHFIRSFKTLFQQTPYQFILNEKLCEAQKLRSQEYSYSQIAEMVGFSDPKNLKKALRQKRIVS